uniref:Uncharacterized protein n=1 Tax=Meloidogyne incognita TaxID=6306 RepID=A0A914LP03_MELIC
MFFHFILIFLLISNSIQNIFKYNLFHHSHPSEPKKPSNPIVIIPGDAGSRLRANLTGKPSTVHIFCDKTTKDYFDLWLNLELFSPLIIDCWADNMRLEFNVTTGMAQELEVVLPPSRLRTMQRSFTSSALLFPSPKLWGPNETFVITPRKNYSLSNIEDFFTDIEFPQGLEQWKSESPSLIIDPPGVKVYCIYGSEVKTPEQYIWYHNWLFPDYQPYLR